MSNCEHDWWPHSDGMRCCRCGGVKSGRTAVEGLKRSHAERLRVAVANERVRVLDECAQEIGRVFRKLSGLNFEDQVKALGDTLK